MPTASPGFSRREFLGAAAVGGLSQFAYLRDDLQALRGEPVEGLPLGVGHAVEACVAHQPAQHGRGGGHD